MANGSKPLELLERKCLGCFRTFRALKTSAQKYHSLACELFHTGKTKVGPMPGHHEEALYIPNSGIIEPEED
jgi:hypothetical protein